MEGPGGKVEGMAGPRPFFMFGHTQGGSQLVWVPLGSRRDSGVDPGGVGELRKVLCQAVCRWLREMLLQAGFHSRTSGSQRPAVGAI